MGQTPSRPEKSGMRQNPSRSDTSDKDRKSEEDLERLIAEAELRLKQLYLAEDLEVENSQTRIEKIEEQINDYQLWEHHYTWESAVTTLDEKAEKYLHLVRTYEAAYRARCYDSACSLYDQLTAQQVIVHLAVRKYERAKDKFPIDDLETAFKLDVEVWELADRYHDLVGEFPVKYVDGYFPRALPDRPCTQYRLDGSTWFSYDAENALHDTICWGVRHKFLLTETAPSIAYGGEEGMDMVYDLYHDYMGRIPRGIGRSWWTEFGRPLGGSERMWPRANMQVLGHLGQVLSFKQQEPGV